MKIWEVIIMELIALGLGVLYFVLKHDLNVENKKNNKWVK